MTGQFLCVRVCVGGGFLLGAQDNPSEGHTGVHVQLHPKPKVVAQGPQNLILGAPLRPERK